MISGSTVATSHDLTYLYESKKPDAASQIGENCYTDDDNGNASQFVCYTPYGEAIVDEHLTTYENPFKFSGKELDDITGLYDHGARSRNPISTLWYGVDPLFEKYPDFSPYNYCAGNPIKLVDPDGRGNEDSPILYHNTPVADEIFKEGFNATNHGKYSHYNWFSSKYNAGGTGRTGVGVTLGVEGIDVSNAVVVTDRQMKNFYNEAKKELGYTSEQIKSSKEIAKEVDGLKYSKLGKWMDEQGAPCYKVGNAYAVSDKVANQGTIVSLSGSEKSVKALNGLRIGSRILTLGAMCVDGYEIWTSTNKARTVTSVIGGWTGAYYGASLGGKGGAVAGSLVGPEGTVIGGAAGTLIGGAVGYFIGREVTETIYDKVVSYGFKIGK